MIKLSKYSRLQIGGIPYFSVWFTNTQLIARVRQLNLIRNLESKLANNKFSRKIAWEVYSWYRIFKLVVHRGIGYSILTTNHRGLIQQQNTQSWLWHNFLCITKFMKPSWHWNVFHVTGTLCGEMTGYLSKRSNIDYIFTDSLNIFFNKQSIVLWFERR